MDLNKLSSHLEFNWLIWGLSLNRYCSLIPICRCLNYSHCRSRQLLTNIKNKIQVRFGLLKKYNKISSKIIIINNRINAHNSLHRKNIIRAIKNKVKNIKIIFPNLPKMSQLGIGSSKLSLTNTCKSPRNIRVMTAATIMQTLCWKMEHQSSQDIWLQLIHLLKIPLPSQWKVAKGRRLINWLNNKIINH